MNVSIYNMHFATFGGGERRTAAIAAHLSVRHNVTLFVFLPTNVDDIRKIFGIDLSRVNIVDLCEKDHIQEIQNTKPDIFINNSYDSPLVCPAPAGIYMCMFPSDERIDLSSYKVITANSKYTAKWIEKRWNYQSEVIYSACQIIGVGSAKQNTILNVARFFADMPEAHHKRQDVLLRAFRRMVDTGTVDWELHLVGNVASSSRDLAFVDQLRAEAQGYPVRILVSLDFDTLLEEYRKSSIYWHATGYGFSEDENPSKQEHFGMSIIEAMSAGAVPLAFNAGGPRETVKPGINGFLWNEPEELLMQTRFLMEDAALLQAMSAQAVADSVQFSAAEFLARMDAIIARLTATRI